MKKIVLLGDSIRMGYDKYVKNALHGVAEVYYPGENCQCAQHLLRFMHQWKNDMKWPADVDLVHFNAGLWDVAEIYGEEPITLEEQYAEMIRRIDRQIRRLFPGAKVVFATSTSVIEERYRPEFKRHNSNIERYNEIAREALSDSDCLVYDMFEFTKAFPEECRSDMTHFNTSSGIKKMGDRVLSVICGELDINANDVNIENFVPENYSAKNIGC
jgi:hypothetical protein